MTDRITKANLEARVENLNRRMAARGSIYHYEIGYRYGYTAIDRMRGSACIATVRAGMTKNEAGEFLHAMMVALDDAAYTEDAYAGSAA